MILYINKNCSGYHWYQCQLPDVPYQDGMEPIIRMGHATTSSTDVAVIAKLRMFNQYDYCFVEQENKYILALNNIPERRKDDYGRPISIKLIFVADAKQRVLLFKMLFDKVEDFDRFARNIDPCFGNDLMAGCILCSWKKLSAYFEELGERKFTQSVAPVLSGLSGRLLMASPNSARTMKELGFKDAEINRAISVLANIGSTQFLTEGTKKSDPGEEPGKSDETEAASQPEQEPSGKGQENVPSISPNSPLTNVDEIDKLQGKLTKLEKDKEELECENSNLERKLAAIKSELERCEAGFTKKIRLLKNLIAASIAIIIILIVMFILK